MSEKSKDLLFPSDLENRIMEIAKILEVQENRDLFAYKIVDILIWKRKNHNFLFPSVEAREQSLSGRWVFAVQHISEWEQIAKFWWNIVHISEWFRMPEEVRMWHIMVWPEFTIWATDERDIDGGDFINHSCEPNCWVQWHLDLVAMRNIAPWEEIVFDYGTVVGGVDIEKLWWNSELWEHLNSEWSPLIIPDCKCESWKCRGQITWDDWKKLMTKKRYKGFFPHHIQKLINDS